MTVPNLHDSDDTIELLMGADEYNSVWRKIDEMPRHSSGESFWQEVEKLLNECLCQLFMAQSNEIEDSGDPVYYIVGLDGDKLHYNWSSETRCDGLKKDHHAKDNHLGFTSHTVCHSASAVPVNISFQHTNETVRKTLTRMVNDMFGKHTGGAVRLDNVELAMDHGYCCSTKEQTFTAPSRE